MTGTIDDRYFEWLYGLVGTVRNRNPARSYWSLARLLYSKEFVWLVANDDNRVADGKDLRHEFTNEQGSDGVTDDWLDLGCSVLEILIVMARMASFETGVSVVEWFWTFIKHLGFAQLTDEAYSPIAEDVIDDVLNQFIYRTYAPDGTGGLFPLEAPAEDQRNVELWYQLAAYLVDRP